MSKETNGTTTASVMNATQFKIEKLKDAFSGNKSNGAAQAIEVFRGLQKAEYEAYRAKLQAQKPFFQQRSELIKQTPKFWLNVFARSGTLRHFVTAGDQEALENLEDVTMQWKEDVRDYDLIFHFKENPFFTNPTLTKSFTVQPPSLSASSSSSALPHPQPEPYDLDAELYTSAVSISWKSDEKNLTLQYPRVDVNKLGDEDEDEEDDAAAGPGSFFNWFGEGPEDVFGFGESFLEIHANAHEIYAGLHETLDGDEAGDDDDEDEDGDEEDDDEDDDQGKEIDLDEEEAKRQRKRQRRQ